MLIVSTINKKILVFCILNALLLGLFIDYSFGHKLDYWIHDSAVVFQHRTRWEHSAVVALDDGVPYSVGRKQALPLFAKATERLVEAGVKGVFFDARVSIEQEGRMPYARCIENDGSVQWSEPQCSTFSGNQCSINNSELGNAPLQMNAAAIELFKIAPYLDENSALPEMLLYGFDAALAMPQDGVVASDRLVTFDSPIARWMDLSTDHAVYKMVEFSQPNNVQTLFQSRASDVLCNMGFPCRRLRQSLPGFKIVTEGKQLILPVSLLASCDKEKALQAARRLKDKVVVYQVAAPNESTDLIVTAMTTASLGPKLMTPGAQYLVDAIETILNNDGPQAPSDALKYLLFIVISVVSVMAAAIFQQTLIVCLFVGVIVLLGTLCFFNPIVQLWPVMASISIFIIGASQMVFFRMFLGLKEGKLMSRYISAPIHKLLMSLKVNESFKIRRCHVVILMSDLAGYTTVTGLLKDPELILDLMNDYLEETSLVLQKKHDGILEAYVGDMVCYYWADIDGNDRANMYKKALLGAVELRKLQKQFFATLQQRYQYKIDEELLQKINGIIDAGIGVTEGEVVMGDLGPKNGVKKFGILGDPLNLAARIESLTRLFNANIIIAGDFLGVVHASGLVTRRLGRIKVKGRLLPENLYALGIADNGLFEKNNIENWTLWLDDVEAGIETQRVCPECYHKDQTTINNWLKCKLLGDDGVWYLDSK